MRVTISLMPTIGRALLVGFVLLMPLSAARAAALFVLPGATQVERGDTVSVEIKIDSEGAYVNAAQATLHFPPGILQVQSVDKQGSVFSFWVQEPTYSNTDGTVQFLEGSPKGTSGAALQVVRVIFKATGTGVANLTLSDAAVTASDGKGTNVLSRVLDARVGVGVAAPSAAPGTVQPTILVRPAVPTTAVPAMPTVQVPLYPDQGRWYNKLSDVTVLWDVPANVSAVAVALDASPNTIPSSAEKALVTGKNFGVLRQGVFYVHVRFRNSSGWGGTAHYKISLDTEPPLPFDIQTDATTTDNPTPVLTYDVLDGLSGVAEVQISIDGKEPTAGDLAKTTLSALPPGDHTITVLASDRAQNSVKDTIAIQVLPLETPVITYVPSVVVQGEVIYIAGRSIPNGFVDVALVRSSGTDAYRAPASTDNSGNWELRITSPLAVGSYTLTASTRDSRGAISYPTAPASVAIQLKPVISIGSINVSWPEITIIVILLVAALGSLVAWWYATLQNTRAAYVEIASNDTEKLAALLEKQLLDLRATYTRVEDAAPASDKEEITSGFEAIAGTIGKMRKYLKSEVNKLQ